MQTFSKLQRNSAYYLSVKFWLLAGFLLFYEIFSANYRFLPPLLGVFMQYLMILTLKAEQNLEKFDFRWYVCVVFLIFCEQIQGFFLFSSIITFLIYFYFLDDYLRNTIKFKIFLIIGANLAGYFGILCVSNLISYMKNLPLLPLCKEYFLYVIIESIISLFLFKDKI